MKLNKKSLPAALLNRVAFWAVVFGCIAAFIASAGGGASSGYATALFDFVSTGVSIGAIFGWLHYLIYSRKS